MFFFLFAAQGSAPGTEVGAGATCNATCTGANFECVASKCTCKAGFTLSGNSCSKYVLHIKMVVTKHFKI